MFKNIQDKIYKLLRWSQKYTKTDMVYLAKGGFWLSVGQVITAVAGILLAMAFANWLPKEIYGQYKFLLAGISLLNISTFSGINSAVNRAVARGNDGSFFDGLKKRIKYGLIGSIFSIIVGIYYLINQNIELSIAFFVIAIAIPFFDSLSLYQSILIGKKEFKKISQYRTVVEIIAIIIMIGAIYFSKNLLLILSAYLFIHIILHLIFLKITLSKIKLDKNKKEDVVTFGKHLTFMNIIVLIGNQIDKILVYKFVGIAQLAVYSFATDIPEKFRTFFKNTNILLAPKLSANHEIISKKNLNRKMGVFILFIIPIIIIYILIAPYLWHILFPQYSESIFYSQIYSLTLLSIPFTTIGFSFMTAQKNEKSLYAINSYGSVIKIFLIFLGLLYGGLMGLIVARVLYQFILSMMIFFYPQKK